MATIETAALKEAATSAHEAAREKSKERSAYIDKRVSTERAIATKAADDIFGSTLRELQDSAYKAEKAYQDALDADARAGVGAAFAPGTGLFNGAHRDTEHGNVVAGLNACIKQVSGRFMFRVIGTLYYLQISPMVCQNLANGSYVSLKKTAKKVSLLFNVETGLAITRTVLIRIPYRLMRNGAKAVQLIHQTIKSQQ